MSHPWNVTASTVRGKCEVVLALESAQGNVVHGPAVADPARLVSLSRREPHTSMWGSPRGGRGVAAGGPRTCHQSETMEVFRVKDIRAPEVKFLDRCGIHRSEGVVQVLVRRSRMRVGGSKMIRHRRSPTL